MIKENLIKVYPSPQETAAAFGEYLMKEAAAKDEYHCALSGGSTPKLLFDYLGEKYPGSPVWRKVRFYWGDERCVPPEDKESNFKMTRDHLLSRIEISEGNIHRILGESGPALEADRYEKEICANVPIKDGLPVFDMIILGLGEDGHTASIFPHEMGLLHSDKVCEVATHPTSGQKRVTLTGPVINAARVVVFLVTGIGKMQKIDEILNHNGDWKSYPASHIRPVSGELWWYLDEPAAQKIKKP